jgi:predicted Rossmann fold flavoprotein
MADTPDVIVVGGGASGLMCAISAGYRGLKVRVLEMGPKVGLKILVSGGGRCNFTNVFSDPRQHYLSSNPPFCISAMARFSPADFIAMVENAGIGYHEKKLGQLFCDHSARDIVAMLLGHCDWAGVDVRVKQTVTGVRPLDGGGFAVDTANAGFTAPKVVLASGGLSMPRIASDLAFRTARQLGAAVVTPSPALVPFTWTETEKSRYAALSGISLDAAVTTAGTSFRENILFTHRGLSGPAILQISSFWREGDTVRVNLLPDTHAGEWLLEAQRDHPRQQLATVLRTVLPRRLVDLMSGDWFVDARMGEVSATALRSLGDRLNAWEFRPGGTEGYRTAEVTLGGIATNEVSSKTFEFKRVPGLYAVGEALDVTGWLGGYNFQWAWASGWCCGQHL